MPQFEFSVEVDKLRANNRSVRRLLDARVAQSRWLLPCAFTGHLFEQCTLDIKRFANRRVASDAVQSTEFGSTFAYKFFRKLPSLELAPTALAKLVTR